MELGVGMFGDNHYDANGKPMEAGARLREMIDEIKLMDETGLDFFGIGEHHRADYAVSVPEIILAAASVISIMILHQRSIFARNSCLTSRVGNRPFADSSPKDFCRYEEQYLMEM